MFKLGYTMCYLQLRYANYAMPFDVGLKYWA